MASAPKTQRVKSRRTVQRATLERRAYWTYGGTKVLPREDPEKRRANRIVGCRVGQVRVVKKPVQVRPDALPLKPGSTLVLLERVAVKLHARTSSFKAWKVQLPDGSVVEAFQAEIEWCTDVLTRFGRT